MKIHFQFYIFKINHGYTCRERCGVGRRAAQACGLFFKDDTKYNTFVIVAKSSI